MHAETAVAHVFEWPSRRHMKARVSDAFLPALFVGIARASTFLLPRTFLAKENSVLQQIPAAMKR